ncbi:abhydrolase domain-containing protein 2 isoform X2 [Stomoxys calcitrans]|nr:abhydrolase domain-containing protein 2 isoform X2 [Stomoxys calcitrans]XP_059220455.1 abhydrolase domain-containing protein 2 isoform X2 [Stomoxys calcitrans]XP_059220456.1 abhydrolase domain-containing protein 2 isoform X2 [Stomoxys calcitrans]XP_059220457.1 abhydrolase domain-containing protein 2 isoform X2 [Stomoxys calcitrans]XP_059220458.1 abhydrolase domain-containing protein 2 isoform X2 [Stomoxys calcitrans]XP_059220459.1 abhydrolase domain-containing protein 2 isoform X2 [Stomoxys
MSTAFLTAIAVILCILFRILNVNSQPLKPSVWCLDQQFLDCLYKIAPVLKEPYIPTRLWGFSGHVQTVLHSIVGRVKCPWPLGERVYLSLEDGSTLTYDLYQPLKEFEDDITVAICPGIGNTSESVYIRTFVHYAQCHGYRCAVLNHIGALGSVQVTSSRIFTYGHTDDFAMMIENLSQKYSNSYIVACGFSLGGNLVTKYLGEKHRIKPSNVIGGISICQGYNAVEGTKWLLNWQNFRRFYLYVMTENMKNIILKHRHILLSEECRQRHNLNERDIIAAATLPELDEAYTRRIFNFPSTQELYKWSSSINYFDNIEKPMIFINAKDDPLVPEDLLSPIKDFAASREKTCYIELAHGGHLGFYEGGLIYPNPVTWLDRTLIAMVGSLVMIHIDPTKQAMISTI